METNFNLVFVGYCAVYTFYDKVIQSRGEGEIKILHNDSGQGLDTEEFFIVCTDVNNNTTASFFVDSHFIQHPARPNVCQVNAFEPVTGPNGRVRFIFKFSDMFEYGEFKDLMQF